MASCGVSLQLDESGRLVPSDAAAGAQLRGLRGQFALHPSPANVLLATRMDAAEARLVIAGLVSGAGAMCDWVAYISQGNLTGELIVMTEGGNRSVFFDRGVTIGAISTVAGERLGEILAHHGVLSEVQIAHVMTEVGKGQRFGEAAVSLGLLSNEQLFAWIARQIETIVHAILRVADGTFYFMAGYDESRLPARQHLPTQHLLMEGVRRVDEMTVFRKKIPDDDHVPERTSPWVPEPSDPVGTVFGAIDGRRSVREIVRVTSLDAFVVTQMLYQLVQAGHARVLPARPSDAAGALRICNQALYAIYVELEAMDAGSAVRAKLSEAAVAHEEIAKLLAQVVVAEDGTLEAKPGETLSQDPGALRRRARGYVLLTMFLAEQYLRGSTGGSADHARKAQLHAQAVAKRVGEIIAPLAD